MRRVREDGGIFAVVVEGANEAPILMEAEGQGTSYEDARAHLEKLTAPGGRFFRGCVVSLQFEAGNSAVLTAMEGMQDTPHVHWFRRERG